jgi:zinc protease
MIKRIFLSVLLFLATHFIYAAESDPAVPESLQNIMAALPEEARPQEMRRAHNGAYYALLPNGCEMIIFEKHSAPVVTVQGWMRTGSIHENKWMGAGISHFCEHMLFKGTSAKPREVLEQEIRGAGGDDNAYTTYERTTYHVTCAADGFATSFNVVSDMLMDSVMPPEEAGKEHGVVYKEIERSINTADSVLNDVFQRLIYQVHPYGVPVLGYPDRFKTVNRDDVFAYYQQRYSPQMCTFVIVGDVDPAKVMPLMAEKLSKWKRKSVEPVAIPEEPEQIAPRSVTVSHPLCELPKVMLGFPSVSIRHEDLYALDLLASILGDGRPSRLYREVKDKQKLVLDITAWDYTPIYPGVFAVMATADPANVEAAREAILKVVYDARTQAPTADELARAKRKIYTQHIFGQMTVDGIAENIGSDWFTAGDLDFQEHYTERIQNVTGEDILRVAKKYLVEEKLNVAIMNCAAKEGEAKPVETSSTKEAAEKEKTRLAEELAQLQKDPSVEKASLLAEKSVFEFTLKPSGVRVVLKEDKSLPVLNITLAGLGGTRWEPADLAGSGNLMSEMLDRGTAKRNKMKISEEAEALGASLSTFGGKNSFGVAISGLKQDSPKLIDLVSDCLLHANFPEDEFEKLKEDTIQRIAQEDESLFTLSAKILRPLLYGSHPYSRQTLGTPETVKKVTVADLKNLHEAWVQPENVSVSFVGDITAREALEMARQHFGQMKPGSFKAPQVPPIPALTTEKSGEGTRANISNDILELAFPGVNLKNPDRETLDLMSGLLSGLGGRFFVAIREKLGIAYVVDVSNDSQLDGGAFIFAIQTDEKNVDKALQTMWDEVKRLRSEEVSDKELESIKTYMGGTEAIELQDQSGVAMRLALSQLYEEGAAYMFGRRARLAKVTPKELKAIAEKYLTPDRWAKALLKPK